MIFTLPIYIIYAKQQKAYQISFKYAFHCIDMMRK